MRILTTSYSYPPYLYRSGIGKVAKNLVDILSKKNEVFVISGRTPFGTCVSQKNVFRVGVFPVTHPSSLMTMQFRLRSLKVAKKLLKEHKFDVFHDHIEEGVKIAEYIKREKLKTKVIDQVHGVFGLAVPFRNLGAIMKCLITAEAYLNTMMLRTGFKQYDEYLAVSKFMKRYMVSRLGLEKNKVMVLYPPVDTTKYVESKEKERKVVFCGFLGSIKRAHWVIKAANELINNRGIKAKFAIIGSGDQYSYLKRSILKYSLNNHVKLMGYLDEKALIKEYQTARVFTLPSLFESFGQVIAEAMCCGTPVLVSNNSAMSEIVEGGKTGLKFETFNFLEYVDKMEYMLTNENEARRMGTAAREYVLKNFSFLAVERELNRVYRKVLTD